MGNWGVYSIMSAFWLIFCLLKFFSLCCLSKSEVWYEGVSNLCAEFFVRGQVWRVFDQFCCWVLHNFACCCGIAWDFNSAGLFVSHILRFLNLKVLLSRWFNSIPEDWYLISMGGWWIFLLVLVWGMYFGLLKLDYVKGAAALVFFSCCKWFCWRFQLANCSEYCEIVEFLREKNVQGFPLLDLVVERVFHKLNSAWDFNFSCYFSQIILWSGLLASGTTAVIIWWGCADCYWRHSEVKHSDFYGYVASSRESNGFLCDSVEVVSSGLVRTCGFVFWCNVQEGFSFSRSILCCSWNCEFELPRQEFVSFVVLFLLAFAVFIRWRFCCFLLFFWFIFSWLVLPLGVCS